MSEPNIRQETTLAPTPADVIEQELYESIEFVYRIEGDNQLNLNELLQILTSLGELIQESNRVVHPQEPDVSISVKPFEEGSFDIELILSSVALGPLMVAWQTGAIHKVIDVLSNVGVIASKAAKGYTSLLELIKKLKGDPPKEVKELEKGARYEVTTEDGEVMQINAPVQNLYQNSTIIHNLNVVYGDPLKKPKRKKVQSYLKNDKETLVEVAPTDQPALREAKPLTAPNAEPEQETENTSVVFLRPKRGSFEGEASKWSFRMGQGEVLQANIKDTDFLNKLERGEYRLSGSDVLKVELKQRQKVVGNDIKTTNEIIKVLEYKSAPNQSTMFDGGSGMKK
jgi:hypothetical protein